MSKPASISTILKTADGLMNNEDRKNYLRLVSDNNIYQETLRDIIQMAYHPRIEWELPRGPVAYTPLKSDSDAEYRLLRERRSFYVFLKGGVTGNIKAGQREKIFVQMLESVDPEDAKLLVCCKDRWLPYPNLTYDLLQDTFPNWLPTRDPIVPTKVVPSTKETLKEEVKVKKESVNKGKTWFTDGLKNFLLTREDGAAKGYTLGRKK